MKNNPLITIPLWTLVMLGFLSALKLSVGNLQGQVCPHLFFIPICYVVFVAYALMLIALIFNHKFCRHHLFSLGWGSAFIIAFFASVAEFISEGAICPVSDPGSMRAVNGTAIPLCYISLAILIVILILYISGPYKKMCAVCNKKK